MELSPQQGAAVKQIGHWFANETDERPNFTLCGFAGTGKQAPMDSLLQTPYGSKTMGEIALGDAVFDHNGEAVEVVGIFPQGIQPCYLITFRDGTSTRAGPDHLWTVFEGSAAFDRNRPKTITTQEMLDTGTIRPCGLMRYRTPLNGAVQYAKREALPIDPWLLGVLIGDGNMCNGNIRVTVANNQLSILDRILTKLPPLVKLGAQQRGSGCVGQQLVGSEASTKANPLMVAIRALKLDVKGPEKFIPKPYLLATIEDRYEILRGLMDSDGSIRANRTSFSTSSPALAADIATLVRSLGGVAVVRSHIRDRDSVVKIEFDVNIKTLENPFWLEQKASKWSYSAKNPPSKYIRSIERIEDCEQQCIMVDSDEGLYLTDDFIVTHNSTILPDILDAVGLSPGQVAFCAPTGKAAKVMGAKLRAQGINVFPSTIHSLIYTPKPQKADVLEHKLAECHQMIVGLKDGSIHPPSGDLKADIDEAEKTAHILKRDLERAYDLNDLSFSLNPESRLVKEQIKLIIADEGSMIGKTMAGDLMDFEIPTLVMGDPGQLPPVGDEPGFLYGQPDAFLTQVHRQAAENPIIYLATMARKGHRIEFGDYGDGVLVVPKRQDIFTLDPDRDCQVIVGRNKTRWDLTAKMRREAGFATELPCVGEPLIMCKNSRENPTLVNGTQVYSAIDHGEAEPGRDRFLAEVFDEDGKRFRMFTYQGLFEEHAAKQKNFASCEKNAAWRSRGRDHHVDFAWAITCHKSQGSQWDEVIVHDESAAFREDSDKWLYTAITRAAERLVLVC